MRDGITYGLYYYQRNYSDYWIEYNEKGGTLREVRDEDLIKKLDKIEQKQFREEKLKRILK